MNNCFPVIDTVATGARIKELRKEHHLKVSEVRVFMGFESDQAIYKWQRGESMPTIDNLYALSVLFETSIDDIIRGSKEEADEASFGVYGTDRYRVVHYETEHSNNSNHVSKAMCAYKDKVA